MTSQDTLRAIYADPVVGNFIAAILLAVVAYLYSRLLLLWRRQRPTPRAWGRLNTMTNGRRRFRATDTGAVVGESVHGDRKGREVVPPDSSQASLAIAPDGTVIATVVGQKLRLSAVTPSSGRVHGWKEPIDIPAAYTNPKVLAVEAKGQDDAWLALAATVRNSAKILLLCTESQDGRLALLEKASDSLGMDAQGAYAAFLGVRLLFGKDKAIEEIGPGDHKSGPWRPTNLHHHPKDVIAVDVAKVGGHTFVALLEKGDDAKTKLIVMPAYSNVGCYTLNLNSSATHMTVVRDPDGDPKEMCLLSGSGLEMKRVFPHRTPGAIRPKWWLFGSWQIAKRRPQKIEAAVGSREVAR